MADPLDDLRWRERFAKNLDRSLPPGLADDIALGAQSLAERLHGGADVFTAAIDAADGKHKRRMKAEG